MNYENIYAFPLFLMSRVNADYLSPARERCWKYIVTFAGVTPSEHYA